MHHDPNNTLIETRQKETGRTALKDARPSSLYTVVYPDHKRSKTSKYDKQNTIEKYLKQKTNHEKQHALPQTSVLPRRCQKVHPALKREHPPAAGASDPSGHVPKSVALLVFQRLKTSIPSIQAAEGGWSHREPSPVDGIDSWRETIKRETQRRAGRGPRLTTGREQAQALQADTHPV